MGQSSSKNLKLPERENEMYIANIPPLTLEQIEPILDQLKTCICKIYKEDGNKGTGFFCKIPYSDNFLPFLITNNHILNKDENYLNKTIKITINNDKIKETTK